MAMDGSEEKQSLLRFRRNSRTLPPLQLELLGTPGRVRVLQRLVAALIMLVVMYGFITALDGVTMGVQRYLEWAFSPGTADPKAPVMIDLYIPAPSDSEPTTADPEK
jgi:hypothetical protein